MNAGQHDFDLIVIGGGINGVGIARDAALRGLKVCLLEQGDLCNGTSRWCSRLIHGGLRYLEHAEFSLVRESLREREVLLHIAPHLVEPLAMLVPLYAGARRGRWLVGAGMWLYDLLSWDKSLPKHRMLDVQEALRLAPGLRPEGLVGAAHYFDAQVAFPERLVIENALSAVEAGASIRSYCRVDRILVRDRRLAGVRYTDLRNDTQHDLTAARAVNAAGPWVDRVLDGLDRELPDFMGGTKGTHIITRRFEGAPETACYVEAHSDGRPFFILPWNGLLLIGTTDIRYAGNPGEVNADPAELDYLSSETNHVFPGAKLDRHRILYHYTGVRPLPKREKGSEGAITRRHSIRHHRRVCRGLYSVIGGKLTTYRNLAEEMTDRIVRSLSVRARASETAARPLPGATVPLSEVDRTLRSYQAMSDASREHLLAVYGARALEVASLTERSPELGDVICPATHAIAAEIVFAFEQEMATTLSDVLMRRSMIGLAPDLGAAALPGALSAARRFLGWDRARADQEERRHLRTIAVLRSGLN